MTFTSGNTARDGMYMRDSLKGVFSLFLVETFHAVIPLVDE